jgi:hypothetical protein
MKIKLALLSSLLSSSCLVATSALAQTAQVNSVQPIEQPGLYLANGVLQYSDGDALQADFRVYCPTSTIRPTNYALFDARGHVKQQGDWWEPPFQPQYPSEYELVRIVCGP